jgi:hypothetical protein
MARQGLFEGGPHGVRAACGVAEARRHGSATPQAANKKGKRTRERPFALSNAQIYFASFDSSAFFRLSQLYFFWNFSTRPAESTNFILPVKNGWHTEQISTEMFFFVERVVNLLPQPQVTVASSYLG